MQNKMVRFILDKGPRAHIGQKELDSLGFLNVGGQGQSTEIKSCI